MWPSHIGNFMSGWSNYSGKVTEHKIDENLMDNRVSKSSLLSNNNNLVKEQRVYGSYHWKIKYQWLRCTLMAFERRYHIKIPSNLSEASYSKMNPWFVTGLIDAEGSFTIKIGKRDQGIEEITKIREQMNSLYLKSLTKHDKFD